MFLIRKKEEDESRKRIGNGTKENHKYGVVALLLKLG